MADFRYGTIAFLYETTAPAQLCAFSYAGQLFLVVTADAGSFPDLDVLMAGMERDWRALSGSRTAEPIWT